jgi:hypothetical protein
LTFVVLFAGLGIVSVPAGLFSTALLKARSMESEQDSTNRTEGSAVSVEGDERLSGQ